MTNLQPYTDYHNLSKDRLIELNKHKDKIIQIYMNRGEKLDRWLNEREERCDNEDRFAPSFYPWCVLEKINEIANEEIILL